LKKSRLFGVQMLFNYQMFRSKSNSWVKVVWLFPSPLSSYHLTSECPWDLNFQILTVHWMVWVPFWIAEKKYHFKQGILAWISNGKSLFEPQAVGWLQFQCARDLSASKVEGLLYMHFMTEDTQLKVVTFASDFTFYLWYHKQFWMNKL
jgi:hypothetical protein